jgi:predicted nucleic acid-binding protein
MRIFLDTNVVLTGALNEKGPAGTLEKLVPSATFFHSPQVLAECDGLLLCNAQSDKIRKLAERKVRSFLDRLNSESVLDSLPPKGLSAVGRGDNLILGAAIAANADAICTYNIKDFPVDHPAIKTPLSVHRAIASPVLEQYIQHILLSSEGTILFFGRLHHPSSMGPILSSSNGNTVTADAQGFIHLSGPNVTRHKALKP